tara:strand:+ start:91 stop:654 length:564 start_codon:yes stop_codon:yes gene_type:complete
MAFWKSSESQPKRNFRFQVQLGTTAGDVLWWAKSVTVPSWDLSEVEHDFLDNKYYFPGRVTWSEVSLTLVDPISIDAVARTNDILAKSGYVVKDENQATGDQASTISKNKAVNDGGLVVLQIEVLDATGKAIEVWKLNNPFIKSAKFGDLDYSSDDLRTVELTIRYDWATCDTSGNDKAAGTKSFFE